jgi:hypothetical protein
MAYLRLRQLCLVAEDLEQQAQQIGATFGLSVAYRDPHVAEFGLANVLIPIGSQPVFLEIVSPITDGTTAGRYLARRGGDGGYMVICDDEQLDQTRNRLGALGVRIIREGARADEPAVDAIQLHPKDTGGTLLEFDRHGAGLDMRGGYRWAGDDWQRHVCATPVSAVLGVEIQSPDPQLLADRWSEIFNRPLNRPAQSMIQLDIDNAFIRFVADSDGRGEGLSAIHLNVTAMPDGAKDGIIDLCGVRFYLHPLG